MWFGGRVIALTVLGALLVTAPPVRAGELKFPGKLSVFDAEDRLVGHVVGVQGTVAPIVAQQVGQVVYALLVTPGNLVDAQGPGLFFASTDCSGPAFMLDPTSVGVIREAAIAPPGRTVYVATPGATPQLLPVVQSGFVSYAGCYEMSATDFGPVLPALALTGLDHFVPPFSIR